MTPTATTTALLSALGQFGPHDHLCSIYESQEEHFAVAVPFVRIGLERGEKCLYIADDGTEDVVRDALLAEGIDVERAIETGALVLTTKEQAYLKHGSFDPEWMFNFWKQATGQAMNEGFSALRATGDTEWVVRGAPGMERWMEYESRLTHTMAQNNCFALCQYNRQLFPPELVLDVIRTHPTVIYGDTVSRNMYHVPPDEFLGTNQTVREVERLLTSIREREQVEYALRQQRNELRRSEAYLAEGQRISHTGSWAWDVASGDLLWSLEHFRIFGLDPYSAKPSVEMFFRMLHPDDRTAVEQGFQTTVRERGEFDAECRIVCPDGRIKYIHSVAHPVFDEHGELGEYVGTVVDITEARYAEETLRVTQAELARAARVMTVGELTASIAHEVNQPLAAVVTNGNACLRWLAALSPDLDEVREALGRIVRDGNRASEVIARIRALLTKTDTEKERMDMNEAIREVVALARGELRRNAVALRTELAADVPRVTGDRVQLQQVLLNLIMNAIEAMGPIAGRPRELVIGTQSDESGLVRVTVRDSGPGLDPLNMEKVFEAFYTTRPQGIGIGLSISRSIVEAHGGRLWAAGNDGPPGATFQFTLPVHVPGAN